MCGCGKCGRPTPRSGLCKDCALDERYSSGPVGGTSEDEEWSVQQTGLDGEAHTGQSTLDGGVAKDGDRDD